MPIFRIKTTLRTIISCTLSMSIMGCAGLFDKDNTPAPTPLANFTPEIAPRLLWNVKTGSGATRDYLKLAIATSPTTIFVSSKDGGVAAVDKITGHIKWNITTGTTITTGPGYGDDLVVVGSRKGIVTALSPTTGGVRWTNVVNGTILAQPAINDGIVVIKTADGFVHGLATMNGSEVWSYKELEPNLILHTASKPAFTNGSTIVGFANGDLVKLDTSSGKMDWQRQLAVPQGAFAITRMIDIDADPVIYDGSIYAATYQGKIASLDFTGRTLWTHDISSYTGMDADYSGVYVSDANSYLWAFGTNNGLVNWRQTQLTWRNISGPAIMGRYIVVGDAQGYLHWLSKRDGHMAARVKLDGSIFSPPIVENNVLYAYTKNGYLAAYTLA